MSSETDDDSLSSYAFGAFTLDIERGALFKGDEEIKLRPQSFEVLRILIARRGKLVSREELHTALWGQKVVTDDSLGHCLIDIRKALGDSDKKIVRTLPRRGYIFTPPEANSEAVETPSQNLLPKPFSAYKELDPYVFVAYSHKDLSIIYPELEQLKESGFNVYYDEGLEAGSEWSEELATRIKHSALFLYFVTPDSVESKNCKNELNFALRNEIPTLIVHLKKTQLPDGLSLSLSAHQAILKHKMTGQEYRQKLENRISAYLERSNTSITHAVREPANNNRAMWLGFAVVAFLALGYLGYGRLTLTEDVRQVHQTEIHPIAIAILPLSTSGEDASAQYYATDLVEYLRSQFRQIPGVSVRAQTSSQAVLSAGFDLPTIAKKLTVQHVIQGSLELTGTDLAISFSVSDESGETRWSQQFHASSDDIGTIKEEASHVIAQQLGVTIAPKISKIANALSSDIEAYRLFLKVRLAPEEKQFMLLKSVLKQIPDYAPFYTELARHYAWQCFGSDDRKNEMCNLAIQYAEQGLKLDPQIAEAFAVLALVHGVRYEYQAAQAALDNHKQLRGQEIYSDAILATYLNLGRLQLAWDAAQLFYQNDPLNPAAAYWMSAWGYHLKNDPAISERFEGIQVELDPTTTGIGAYPSRRKHRVNLKTAIEQARIDMPKFWQVLEELAESWVRPHYEPAYTRTALAEFREYYERGDIRGSFFFQVLLFFYQTDEAMDLAFELYDQRKLNHVTAWLRPPGAKEFRSHPRFIELMETIGIASYWDSVGWPHFCEKRGEAYFCGLEIQVQ